MCALVGHGCGPICALCTRLRRAAKSRRDSNVRAFDAVISCTSRFNTPRAPMLSSEGSTLTNLILARQTLICCAIELDARYEALLAIECAQGDAAAPIENDRASLSPSRRRAEAELVVLPALIDDLEGQIGRAWRRLDKVSPRVLD